MNTRQRITSILKEWLEMTQLECHSLQVGRWSELARIQKKKETLLQPLKEAIEKWVSENPLEAASNPFRHDVVRLLDLETHNSELLAVRKREVREKILLLEQILYDLHLVRSCCVTSSAA